MNANSKISHAASMSTDQLQWLVYSRSRIQELLLALRTIAIDTPPRTYEEKAELHLLIATGFALWRAVFLAHGPRPLETIDEHAANFLEYLVRDNAITYTQDRESKGWTFGYYINDAFFRLEYYHKHFRRLSEHANRVEVFLMYQAKGVHEELDGRNAWNTAFEAMFSATEMLANATKASNRN